MLKLVSLFFHLGLHIGNLNKLVPTNMYNYLLGHRFSRSIFNIRISILYIRKVTLFLLVAGKLNYAVLPVLHGFKFMSARSGPSNHVGYRPTPHSKRAILLRIARTSRIRKALHSLNQCKKSLILCKKLRKKYYPSNNYRFKKYNACYIAGIRRRIKRIGRRYLNTLHSGRSYDTLSDTNNHVHAYLGNDTIANLFYRHRFPILLNTVGLINNWVTYYDTIRNVFSEVIPKYMNNKTIGMIFVKKLDTTVESNFLYNCITLVMCMYYKLNLHIELDIVSYKLKINHLITKFKKFYIFIKFLVYLREYKQFPSILFYLDPNESELATISKYRICTLSLINSNLGTSNYVTYPIPSNFGTYLSKFFYSSLFINAYFIGRILLILNSIS